MHARARSFSMTVPLHILHFERTTCLTITSRTVDWAWRPGNPASTFFRSDYPRLLFWECTKENVYVVTVRDLDARINCIEVAAAGTVSGLVSVRGVVDGEVADRSAFRRGTALRIPVLMTYSAHNALTSPRHSIRNVL
jgi:hypothetical protein